MGVTTDPAGSADGACVLVVDDEDSVRGLIARVVKQAGHRVDTAASASEARACFAAQDFELAICDLKMPGEPGADLLRWIIAEHPDTAVLVATGSADRDTAERVLSLGAYGYLLKPFKPSEVEINISNALRRRSLEIENREYRELLEHRVHERTAQLAHAHRESVQRLARAIEFRSRETGEHVERIGAHAAAIAGRLGLAPERCEQIGVAAVLHDVGKIGISDEILLKPGRLTAEERGRIEEHSEIGYRLLTGTGIAVLELAAEIAWTHHERFDGGGYPRGLAGEDIPIEGRIAAVADVFDALTHDRVYRPALPVDEALGILREGRGTHFDPGVLDAFLEELAS
jgi:putative two-component system response regulator